MKSDASFKMIEVVNEYVNSFKIWLSETNKLDNMWYTHADKQIRFNINFEYI